MNILINKRLFFLLISLLLIYSCLSKNHSIKLKYELIPHLYGYKTTELSEVLKIIQMEEDFRSYPNRNYLGTELHFRPWDWEKDKRLLIFKQDGSYEMRVRQDRPPIPPYAEMDLSGTFYINFSGPNTTEVGCVQNPNKKLRLTGIKGRSIFYKEGKLFVFGYILGNAKRCRDDPRFWCSVDPQIICYIIEEKEENLSIKKIIEIPRPRVSPTSFYVKDMSPFTDDILIIDVSDYWPSKFYLYNLQVRKLQEIGREKRIALFLVDDILQRVKEKLVSLR